ncbi:MAG: hypothetical protein WDO14_13265 [Bacteroidota bacterium]
MKPEDMIENINSREDFIIFLQALRDDLYTNAQTWYNVTIENHLDSMLAWTKEGKGSQNASWKEFAIILTKAKFYGYIDRSI